MNLQVSQQPLYELTVYLQNTARVGTPCFL